MEAKALSLTKILCGKDQYIIPLFQRFYSWERKHWQRLRADIWSLLEEPDEDRVHFMGPLVCTQIVKGPGSVSSYQLIDGQQRLTTLTLLLAAMRDVARKMGLVKLDVKITEDYLIDTKEEDLDRYKLLPRIGDRETLQALVEGETPPESESAMMLEAYAYFKRHLEHLARKDVEKLSVLLSIIVSRLMLVVVTITGEDPYEIFESLNSTGLPLEESDLIRNFVFMQIPMEEQEKFHKKHWKAFEDLMTAKGQGEQTLSATDFYRNFLMRNGDYSRADATFATFKTRYESCGWEPVTLVQELATFLKYEIWMRRPRSCPNEDIREMLECLSLFEMTTSYPLVMRLLHMQATDELSQADLLKALRDLASFVLRRSICGESTRAYGRMFVEISKELDPGNVLDSLRTSLSHRVWPSDTAFREQLLLFPFYRREPKKVLYVLRLLEKSLGHKEQVKTENLTIEHVMPQSLSKTKGKNTGWREMLGENWKADHEQCLHALGNLTLTGYNSELGNRPFAEKKKAYANSHVGLNAHFANVEVWNADEIRKRGGLLAKRIVDMWPVFGDRDSDRPKKAVGLNPVRERRVRYWTGLDEKLREMDSPVKLKNIPYESTIYAEFPGGENVVFWAWFYNQYKTLYAGITFTKRHERAWLKKLHEEKDVIDAEFGEPLEWLTISKRCVGWMETGISLLDEEDWYIQHETLADVMTRLYQSFAPRVEKLAQEAQEHNTCPPQLDKHEGARLRTEYWQAFTEYLERNGKPFTVTPPGPHNWISTHAGFPGGMIAMILNYGLHDRIGVALNLSGKHAKRDFAKLHTHKIEIDAALGAELKWDPLENKNKKARDIRLWREDLSPADRNQWPEQHEWLAQNVRNFLDVFAPYLNG